MYNIANENNMLHEKLKWKYVYKRGIIVYVYISVCTHVCIHMHIYICIIYTHSIGLCLPSG